MQNAQDRFFLIRLRRWNRKMEQGKLQSWHPALIVWSSNYDRKSSRIGVLTRAYFLRIEKLLGFLLGCQYFDWASGFEITEPPWTCEKARASSPFPTTEQCVRLEDMCWVSIYVIINRSSSEDLFQCSLAFLQTIKVRHSCKLDWDIEKETVRKIDTQGIRK